MSFSWRGFLIVAAVALVALLGAGFYFWQTVLQNASQVPADTTFSDQDKLDLLNEYAQEGGGMSVEEKSEVLSAESSSEIETGLSDEEKLQVLQQP